MILQYIQKQINEIANDKALRIYGAFISACYFLCYIQWKPEWKIGYFALPDQAHCWGFFENCFAYRPFTVDQVKMILFAYGIVSLIGIPLFFLKKKVSFAYWWLIFITVFKTLIYIQDYTLRMNQHYMLYFVTLVYLFLPYKRRLLKIAIILFYFWASTLKFNYEWMSGKALPIKPLGIPWRLLPAACVYAAILESVIVWGTLSARSWIFWSSIFQLYLFHVTSWVVVGYFYPLLMFMMLSIFILARLIPITSESKSLFESLFLGKESKIIYLYIAMFSFFQMIPVIIPGDEKITGEGRILALHMIDAHVECEGAINLHFHDGTDKAIEIPSFYINRIKCEPAFNFAKAKRYCYLYKDDPNFKDLDIYYEAKKRTQKEFKPLVDVKDFCSKDLRYDLFKTNEWIIREQ